MKFFSHLGSCCRSMPAPPSREREREEEEGEAIYVALAPSPVSTGHRAKRMRSFGGSLAAQHWRPGLQAIREDGDVNDSDGRNSERMPRSHSAKNKFKDRNSSNSRSISHLHVFHYSRSNSAPFAIPAFSPTPFLL